MKKRKLTKADIDRVRGIEGFPIAKDEDIIALSDAPYYTACPNPFIEEFIRENGTPYDEATDDYHREPFAADVSEGKNDPIYNAHSYHTKVPHKAIMRYILHYTKPGDIVFDGFCGTGMTGVAAQMCANPDNEFKFRIESEMPGVEWGARKAILSDLSPAATFIAYNYNTPVDVAAFRREAERILSEVEKEYGWMYETLHVGPASNVGPASSRPFKAICFEPHNPPYEESTYRRGDLPHVQVPRATYFLTFRTKSFRILSDESRKIALDAVLHWNHNKWEVIMAVVMPDHVHIIANRLQDDLSAILHSVKSYSANLINKEESKEGGSVWQTETYDRVIRDESELANVLTYIWCNPGKAGLTDESGAYAHNYVAAELTLAGWRPAPLGRINYTVWSDVFICPTCSKEMVFWDVAVDKENGKVRDRFLCPHCGSELKKTDCTRAQEQHIDNKLNDTVQMAKQVPVLINYSVGKKRYEKAPDEYDIALIEKIDAMEIPYWYPTDRMCEGSESRRNDRYGITHVHQFYTRRNLAVLAATFARIGKGDDVRIKHLLLFWFTSVYSRTHKLNRYMPNHFRHVGPLSGTLYLPTLQAEIIITELLREKIGTIEHLDSVKDVALVTTASLTKIADIADDSIDYIFTDPPFGGNLNYSELSFLWEAWLKVVTNNKNEAIMNPSQKKELADYQALITKCFHECYRVLKPGHWITVEFHNSQNAVWNCIQAALQITQFIIADIRVLDKQKGTTKQLSMTTVVKQDLVISAYKPKDSFKRAFVANAGSEETAWAFVRQHLENLPVAVVKNERIELIAERQAFLLFDRMVAYHIMNGISVPLDAADFYNGLDREFLNRDGMYFLSDQVNEYDAARIENDVELIRVELFVTNEKSAIAWLYQQLGTTRQTYAELQPQFMQECKTVDKHEAMPELSVLLEDNFLQDEKGKWYVPDMTKSGDVARLREKKLIKEFGGYLATKGKLKLFRAEAIRAGFAKLWEEKNYQLIVDTADRLPEATITEDEKLMMYVDLSAGRL
jgi:REP element-mobilizing transposase RayT